MADHGVFIGFGAVVRGREDGAVKVFGELLQYLGGQQGQRNIESFEPVFLQPHGGDLNGFVLVRGDHDKLDKMVMSPEFDRLTSRGLTVVESFGVVNASLGARIQTLMGSFQKDTTDVR